MTMILTVIYTDACIRGTGYINMYWCNVHLVDTYISRNTCVYMVIYVHKVMQAKYIAKSAQPICLHMCVL